MCKEVCDTGSHITWPYQIAHHNCRITWVYNKGIISYLRLYVSLNLLLTTFFALVG